MQAECHGSDCVQLRAGRCDGGGTANLLTSLVRNVKNDEKLFNYLIIIWLILTVLVGTEYTTIGISVEGIEYEFVVDSVSIVGVEFWKKR